MWGGDKKFRHDDFPVYVGDLPNGQTATKYKWIQKAGMNANAAINELIDEVKSDGYEAICNVRIAGGDVIIVYCNAVIFD